MKKENPSIRLILCVVFFPALLYMGGCKKAGTADPSVNTNEPSPVTEPGTTSAKTAGFDNGVNLQPSYYNGGNPNLAFSLMKQQTKIKTVRIEIEPDKVTQAKSWISQARSNGFAVIATYHKSSVLGSNNTSDLTAAANWWKSNYNTLKASGSFTINLMNEWGNHNISANAFASAYNSAISIVRSVYSGAIIIDIPGWGQETTTAANAAKGANGGTRITDGNYILSAHIYPGAYNQAKGRYLINSDLDELASSGKPCLLGEFGSQGGSGANWSGLVDYAKQKGWTVLGWAWNGDGGSMNMVTPSWASNPGATSFSLSSYFSTVYNKL
jgi:mannan endo-1,4-beta-mannosidase